MARNAIACFLLAVCLTSCGASASVTLRYTLPTTDAIQGACAPSGNPLTDLRDTRLYGRIFGRSDSTLLQIRPAPRFGGVADSFTVTVQETLWDFWSVNVDTLNNQSCGSNVVRKRVSGTPSASTLQ